MKLRPHPRKLPRTLSPNDIENLIAAIDAHDIFASDGDASLVARAFEERLPPHRYYNPADEAEALFSGSKAPELTYPWFT